MTLWILRIGLAAAFVFHVHATIGLTLMNRRARDGNDDGRDPRRRTVAGVAVARADGR